MERLADTDQLAILHLADLEDPRVSEQVLALAAGLVAQRHHVTIAGRLNRRLRERLARLQVRWTTLPWPEETDAPPERAAGQQLARLLAGRPPDVVHAHGLTALPLATAALAQLPAGLRPALIASLYSVPRQLPWLKRRRLHRVLLPAVGARAALLLVSRADQEALRPVLGEAVARTEVVYPAVPETSRPAGVEIGQLRRRMGLYGQAAVVGLRTSFEDAEYETLLQAAARVHGALPNVEFAVIGDGPRLAEAQELAHQLGLSGAAIFLGRPRSMNEAISALNALVVASDAEAAHLEALQALGYGMPVVAARVGALEELLGDMPRAHLVPPGDPEALAAALQQALHVLPVGEIMDQVETEPGRLAGLEQFLVSRAFWDLDQPWERTAHQPTRTQPASEALRRFLPEAVTDRVVSLYRRALADD